MHRHERVRLLESRRLHRGPIFDLLRERVALPSGLEQELDVIAHGGAVAVAPVWPDGRVTCVRQYRHAVGDWLVELPAGRLEPGEDPEIAARRELEEECGLRAEGLERLSEFFVAPGFCSERITLFRASGCSEAGANRLQPDEDEELKLLKLHPTELLATARDAKTLIGAALLLQLP